MKYIGEGKSNVILIKCLGLEIMIAVFTEKLS